MKGPEAFGLFVIGLGIGLAIGSGITSADHQKIMERHNLRAIESGDAQYHPTTGKFMFNGELEENE